MEFIDIGPLYSYKGVGWVVAKAKTKKQGDTMVEFRVAMMSTCTHKVPKFHYKA